MIGHVSPGFRGSRTDSLSGKGAARHRKAREKEGFAVKQVVRVAAGGAMLLGMCFTPFCLATGQTVSAVPQIDLKQYMGVWYEIARFPVKLEKRCVGDGKVLYALGDKPRSFQMGTSCRLKNGSPEEWDASGKMDKQGDGRLKLSRLELFSTKYWVLATGPADDWALVGSPNHKTLWVLSRTASLSPETLSAIEAKASGEGFDTAKLIVVHQTEQ